MHDFTRLLGDNALWVMIIAVVAIANWFGYRSKELRMHEELRTKEMAHLQKMKELEIELEKAKARSSSDQSTGQAA